MGSHTDIVTNELVRTNSRVSSILPDYHLSEDSRPPHYSRHNRPVNPISYSFTDWGSNFMLLVPPPNASEIEPSYKISVSLNLNPFLPISFVTKVEMVLIENDPEVVFVGEFEVSLNQTRGVLTMIGAPTRLSNVLSNVDASRGHWMWTHANVQLRWDCRTRLEDGSPMCVCYGLDRLSIQLATFVPPPILASPPLPAAVFTVFPDGHEFFEHILMSMLVVQRKMTMLL
ncbi:MAG: hypothetical protein NXY57DRAFT_998285 [Lentinula lateritia]|uniref:GPS domain-containing protein n=1 Tax=Lentinula lateritia TaxID=40482 RepID=A0ABQ8VV43_9AGAR|nr:MAG: hypothetical protein NXY57DRAFT_998285 [Lentinula lateritia]KAJ4499452.1 hypothetical protein C8R41DRAFT_814079 [Lentinula lateritia]